MKCQHAGCDCDNATIQRDDRAFCSEHCAEAETSGADDGDCDCGHAECGSSATES